MSDSDFEVAYSNETAALPLTDAEVAIYRYEDDYKWSGPPILVRPLYEIAGNLTDSAHMRNWIIGKIAEALIAGHEFAYRGATGNLRSVYKIRTTETEKVAKVRLSAPVDDEPEEVPVLTMKQVAGKVMEHLAVDAGVTAEGLVTLTGLGDMYLDPINAVLAKLAAAQYCELAEVEGGDESMWFKVG